MQPLYEEKTFESYFNSELDRCSDIFFPFGQVQEGVIGADAAAYSTSRLLWRRLGFRKSLTGVNLNDVAQRMERHLVKEVSNIPSIKVNILFQYKRPEVMHQKNSAEWQHWHCKYFRYEIYSKQQQLLHQLSTEFSDCALVLYASPAIESVEDLVQAKLSKKIIEKTNFCLASILTGHHRNTYVSSGTYSVACSEPQRIEHFDLMSAIENFQSTQLMSNEEALISFAGRVRSSLADHAHLNSSFNSLVAPYLELKIEKFPLMFSFLSMRIVRELTGIQWIFATHKRSF